MLKSILLLLFIIPSALYGQSEELTKVRALMHESSGIWPREQSAEIAVLLENLQIPDLIQLMQSENSLERVYGFWGYVRKENGDYRKYFPELVRDTAKVEYAYQNCNWMPPEAVNSFIFDIAEDLQGYGGYVTYPEYLDSISLEIHSDGDIRGNINCRLMNLQAPPKLYDKLRKRALTQDIPAIIGLASYQKEEDIPLIRNLLYTHGRLLYGLMSVEKFPHPEFEKDLLALYYTQLNQKYPMIFGYHCQILRKYSSQDITNAFNELLSHPNKYPNHIVQLWLSFDKEYERHHPIRTYLIKNMGKREMKKRVEDYKKLDYCKLASEERNKI